MSVGVGSLLHSNGAAIGVSLGFSLGGAILTGLIGNYISETFASLPAAGRRRHRGATRPHASTSPLAAAFAAVVAWLAAFLGAGLWRVLRDEY